MAGKKKFHRIFTDPRGWCLFQDAGNGAIHRLPQDSWNPVRSIRYANGRHRHTHHLVHALLPHLVVRCSALLQAASRLRLSTTGNTHWAHGHCSDPMDNRIVRQVQPCHNAYWHWLRETQCISSLDRPYLSRLERCAYSSLHCCSAPRWGIWRPAQAIL